MFGRAALFCFFALLHGIFSAQTKSRREFESTNNDVVIQEVPYGKTAILKCHSNDLDHIFMFWQLASHDVVGPGTRFNEYKYDYEVLSGNLTIRVRVICNTLAFIENYGMVHSETTYPLQKYFAIQSKVNINKNIGNFFQCSDFWK